ncbi:probable ATP-dependent RNA helicase DDX58 [Mizuhopecten yessoensis]|uniref:RNA helicase n=1 Tax=Mizuhopecten yessoensis TaxID=6573 RepID=A0A210Q291_MIZYE|nr:probable ATP-dependent RNA helicase DDX58 [Mizuhopecten yessoensis]OWF42873.1 ATP-dependent RNA helicase DDX58 [Mizuhopecten yessoensis]
MATPDMSIDDQIEERIFLYKELIVECVIASEILGLLDFIDRAKRQELRLLQKEKGSIIAMGRLLDVIKESQEKNKWSQFADSLCAADYEYLEKTLRGHEEDSFAISNSTHHRKVIELMGPKIQKKLDPVNLMQSLHCYGVLNKQDMEEIAAERYSRGNIAASIVLLDRIPRRHKDWYFHFLQAIHEAEEGKQDDLINSLDSLFLEKYEAKKRDDPKIQKYKPVHNSLSLSTDQDTMENFASGYGSAFTSENYAPPPPNSLPYNRELSDKPSIVKFSGSSSMSSDLSAQEHLLSDILNSRINDEEQEEETSVKQISANLHSNHSQRSGPMSRLLAGLDFSNIQVPHKQVSPSSSYSHRSSMSPLSHKTSSSAPTCGQDRILPNTRNIRGADLENQLNETNENTEKALGLKEVMNIATNTDEAESYINNCDSQMDRETDNSVPREGLKLRNYQMELAQSGLKGHNCIIVAPTGSGKTHVALKIIEEHFKRMRGRRNPKVVFLVEQSALAEQQGQQCRQYLSQEVKVITGETQRTENFQELLQWIHKRDILVVTAQLLVNALLAKDVNITQFSLLVFDECHHSNLKHSFNRIMHHYIDLKLDDVTDKKTLPQVVGLTASVGVGKAKKKEDAITWIEKIMAHLDAHELCTVQQNTSKLREYVSLPEQSTEMVQGRTSNVFGKAINNLMAKIEQYMQASKHAVTVPDVQATLRVPAGRGTDPYTQWLSRLWKETAKVYDQAARRFFTTCRNYLDLYNKSLIIYQDARVKDALDFLDASIRGINERIIKDDTDRKMEQIYDGSRTLLENCLYNAEQVNPKLIKLKEMLVEAYQKKGDSRGIIFVKTRDLVKAIESWMKDDKDLKKLNPVKFVGAQASIEKGGMTKNEQVDVLQYFRDGQHKVIIATSVAEEGLDIQKCNLVIRYDYVTNEIAMVQSRGRGRAEDSKYVLLAAEGGRAAQKEEINLMREAMMQNAIEKLQERIQFNREGFQRRVLKIQMEEKLARDMEATKGHKGAIEEGQFELRCGKCQDYICMSSDVKTIMSAHHAVLCDDITDRVAAKRLNRVQYSDQKLQSGVGKITCRKCGSDLGNVSIFNGIQFPIIKISSFSIVDAYGMADSKKKWKQVPFRVSELSTEDLHALLRRGNRINLLP